MTNAVVVCLSRCYCIAFTNAISDRQCKLLEFQDVYVGDQSLVYDGVLIMFPQVSSSFGTMVQ